MIDMERKLFGNSLIFQLYGVLNLILIAFLLTLLVLIFNGIYLLTRIEFAVFIAFHIFLLFFVRMHYLFVLYDDKSQKIEFHYTRRFSLKWKKNSRTVQLPIKQLDGYKITRDSFGLAVISFFKREKGERYELGPFVVGVITKQQKARLRESFGEPL